MLVISFIYLIYNEKIEVLFFYGKRFLKFCKIKIKKYFLLVFEIIVRLRRILVGINKFVCTSV